MATKPTLRRRLTAAAPVLVAVLAAGSISFSGPVSAQSQTLAFDCTSTSGPEVMTALMDTDAPQTMVPGQDASIAITSDVTVSASRTDMLRPAGITQVDGSVSATITVDGVPRLAPLAIPRVPLPPTPGTPLALVATGSAGSIHAGAARTTIELETGNFSIHLVGYNASGDFVGQATWTCTAQPSQALGIDSVEVARDPSTTKARARYRPTKARLVARAEVISEHGTDVTGKVRFVLKRNGVKLKTAAVRLDDADRARKVFLNIDKPGRYKVVARYLGSTTLRPSVDRAALVVGRASGR